MSIKIRVKRQLIARSERVKSISLHSTESWMLTSLYDGTAYIWNTESKKIIKSLNVSTLPVRAAIFVERKNWIITAADDASIRVFNYNTLEKVAQFSAHRDYIRSLAVHDVRPFLLSAADDNVIRLWDWEKKWTCIQIFRAHMHIVMQVAFNPKDNNQFASASLDKSLKVWQLGSATPNFSLVNKREINCVAYHPGGDKPYIAAGCDGGNVKIWDYQTKSCVHTLKGHAKDVYAVTFHHSMPLILSGGSDGTVRLWHSSTFQMVTSLNFGMERVWALACLKASTTVAIGFDDGAILMKLGREEPAMSMDQSGKIVWAKQSELQQANVKVTNDHEVKDGEHISLSVKDMGSCEVYPQTITHSPNGRFVAVCGDGEFIIYTAVALRSKAYGSAQEFVWGQDSSVYAVREGSSSIKIFKHFKEEKLFKPEMGVDGIYGGYLLGVKSTSSLSFYDWETTELIQRIETTPTQVKWSDNGELVCVITEQEFFILKYHPDKAKMSKDPKVTNQDGEDEDAFEVIKEVDEKASSGVWAGDCFIYTSTTGRLCYCVGGEIVTVSHLDTPMYILGYLPKEDRLYLGDKSHGVVSFFISLAVLEYQTVVMRKDFDTADTILPTVPVSQRSRVAHFLEKQGFRSQAMSVTPDLDHKFDLALHLDDIHTAYDVVKNDQSLDKWKRLSDLALKKCEFGLAQECLYNAQDFAGLLLLASSSGNRELLLKVAQESEVTLDSNVAFTANFLIGRKDVCLELLLEANRLPEAAFFARTYLPCQVSRVVALWRDTFSQVNSRLSGAIADPDQTPNLFPDVNDALKAERFLSQQDVTRIPAKLYPHIPANDSRNSVKEMLIAEASGTFQDRLSTSCLGTNDEDAGDEEREVDGFIKVNMPSNQVTEGPGTVQPSSSNRSPSPLSSPQHSSYHDKTSTNPVGPSEPFPAASKAHSDAIKVNVVKKNTTDAESGLTLSASLEAELALDMEGINIDDFDLDDFDLDSDDLLAD